MNEFLLNYAPILIVSLAMAGLWLLLRSVATPIASTIEFDRIVAAGKPIYLRFFRNT